MKTCVAAGAASGTQPVLLLQPALAVLRVTCSRASFPLPSCLGFGCCFGHEGLTSHVAGSFQQRTCDRQRQRCEVRTPKTIGHRVSTSCRCAVAAARGHAGLKSRPLTGGAPCSLTRERCRLVDGLGSRHGADIGVGGDGPGAAKGGGGGARVGWFGHGGALKRASPPLHAVDWTSQEWCRHLRAVRRTPRMLGHHSMSSDPALRASRDTPLERTRSSICICSSSLLPFPGSVALVVAGVVCGDEWGTAHVADSFTNVNSQDPEATGLFQGDAPSNP